MIRALEAELGSAGWALPQPSLGLEPGLQRQFLPPMFLPFLGVLSHLGCPLLRPCCGCRPPLPLYLLRCA